MRHLWVLSLVFYTICVWAQTTQQSVSTSDAAAISLAQQATAALTNRAPLSDVTLNANVISVAGSDYETGTGVLRAKGVSEARIDLNLSGGTRSDARIASNGIPAGAWEENGASATQYAQHNCWTDPAWFFPALSSLPQSANPSFVFKYVGQEQHSGVAVQHIQSYQLPPAALQNSPISSLTTMDFYLDPSSYLPLAISFNTHADNNMSVNIPVEIRFANYRAISGIQIPFHIQKLLNGMVVLDVTVASAAFNTGLQDSQFTLQ